MAVIKQPLSRSQNQEGLGLATQGVDSKALQRTISHEMDMDERPRPKGDLASQLASELLDPYSHDELNTRIKLLEQEIARTVAHRDRASAHRAAAEALFGKPPPSGKAG